MKQTWGLKILNTSKAKINIFFPLYFGARHPNIFYSLWKKKKPDDQICPVCAFYNLGRRRRLCSYRRAAFGRPRRLTLSSLLRTAKVLFPHFLFLHLYSSLIREKNNYFFIYRTERRRAYLLMILFSSIYDLTSYFRALSCEKIFFLKNTLQYTNMYDFSLYYWIIIF